MRRRDFTLGLGAMTLAACATGRAARKDDLLLFAYFTTGKAGEADGLKLAVSEDGFTFRTLVGGRSLLVPTVGEKKLLRDPFLFHDGRVYHLLWTTAWEGVTIGHATSRDLIHWSAQQAIPVMADVPGTRNCWAPEAIHDPRTGRTEIFWSSTVSGRCETRLRHRQCRVDRAPDCLADETEKAIPFHLPFIIRQILRER